MTNFLLTGVGGQGIILASDILAEVGTEAGLDAKKSEIHGMSQRGGSVSSHVRWGPKVYSPVTPQGEVNYLLAFELMEGARYREYLAQGGVVLLNNQAIAPLPVAAGLAQYPSHDNLMAAYNERAGKVIEFDAAGLARQLGKPAVVSTIMLGALSVFLDIDESIWNKVLESRVPSKLLAVNQEAFRVGRQAIQQGTSTDKTISAPSGTNA